ncbi:MAG: diguanylate cyclase [Candidatus Aminicenantes bacterium]|nr:diguanylate cyclase [Candidatus Aminicenantes bacterium]
MNIPKGEDQDKVLSLKINLLHQLTRDIYRAKNVDEILNRVMDGLVALIEPEAAAFLLRDAATHDLKYSIIRGSLNEGIKGKIVHRGEGLAGLAVETDQDIMITNCSTDPRFNPELENLEGLEFKSVLAVPFRLEKNVFGLFFLINKKGQQSFQADDFNLLAMLVKQAEFSVEHLILLKKMQELEEIDALTGIHTPQGFFKHLQKETSRAERYQLDLSLLEIKIDYYQKLLQTFGQEAGERVITNLSYILKKTTRKVDVIGRIEDDLFLILLPHTNRSGAGKLRERILKILEHQNLRSTGIPYTVTINIFHESGENTINLYNLPTVLNFLNQLKRRHHSCRPLQPGEELEENIMSSLFLAKK